MTWITVAWPMVAAACLTLGLIELRIALAQRARTARILFSLSALTMAAFAGMELALLRVDTVANVEVLLPLMDIAVGAVIALLTAFIWVYFGTGNKWLALGTIALYAIGAAADLVPGSDMTYQSITGVRTIETFGGATFNVVEGVPNPWNVLPYLSALVFIAFVTDASVRLWRRGGRRRALVVGGSVVIFTLTAGIHSALVETGILRTPYLFSWAYIAILLAMASELNSDVLAAARIAVQLRDSERRMDLASEAAGLGMWAWDILNDTVWATSRARSLFGFSESETLSLEKLMNAVHPDDREMRRRALETTLASGKDYEVEYRVSLADGQICWIASRGRVERDANGKPIRIRGVVLDVSKRRGTEMELQQLHNQLIHTSRVTMMGQLASALAHELNQPLGAILRNAEAAEIFLQHDPPDLDELRAILADIRKDDQRAGDVIERLRALLKRRSIQTRALAVSDLLSNAATLTRADAVARHITLEIEDATGLPAVMGDRVHLQQVLLNLIINAMDAVDGAPAERRRVVVRARRFDAHAVEVEVSDCGHGIPSEKLSQVFEPFYTTKENGTGIGLPISRTIVEAHGGRIRAGNNADHGATFRFTLPAAEESVTAEATAT